MWIRNRSHFYFGNLIHVCCNPRALVSQYKFRKKQILSFQCSGLLTRTPVLDQYVIFAFKTEPGFAKFSRIRGGNNNSPTSGYDLAACLIIKAFANRNAVCCHTHTCRLYQLQPTTSFSGNSKYSILYFSRGVALSQI